MPKKDVINKVDKVIPTGDLQLAKKTKNKQQTRGDLATHGMGSAKEKKKERAGVDELMDSNLQDNSDEVLEDYNANDDSCANFLTRNVPISNSTSTSVYFYFYYHFYFYFYF